MSTTNDVFRVLAACTSTMMIMSPIPTIVGIFNAKQTGLSSVVPLASMFANCHVYIFYGYLSEHYFPIFSTFAVGEVLSIAYLIIFYTYTHDRANANKVLALYGVPLALLTVYGVLGGFGVTHQTRHAVASLFAYANILTNLLLYSSPFEKALLVLQHRSAVFLNIHMVCAGTFNNTVWVAYTSLSRQWIIFSVNAFCATMGWLQIVLYLVFHPSSHPYDGPISGVVAKEEVDVELGQVAVASFKSVAVPESPSYVALASPLELLPSTPVSSQSLCVPLAAHRDQSD